MVRGLLTIEGLGADMESVKVFVSYSHADKKLLTHLADHLAILQRQNIIQRWDDRMIGAGQEWAGHIHGELEAAHLILLLVSPSFVASDYCYDVEMKRAIERHEKGQAVVIPIILRPVDWGIAPFGRLQALPTEGKPVTKWANRDDAFQSIAKGIRQAVETLHKTFGDKQFDVSFRGETAIIKMTKSAYMDDPTTKKFWDQMKGVLDNKKVKNVAIDFKEVALISSSLQGRLFLTRHAVRAKNGKVILYNIAPVILGLFKTTRIDAVFVICDDEEQALNSVISQGDGGD